MKLVLTLFYSFGPGEYHIEPPKIEVVNIYIEHMPLELKHSKRERFWPVKPYNPAG